MTYSFGKIFRIQIFGESHGECVGVTIDGCPPGVSISRSQIQSELEKRRPGRCRLSSTRKESDTVRIHSGVWRGKTTGAPLTMTILNEDIDSSPYIQTKDIIRPGHADYTAAIKYGAHNDSRGGGVFSGRMTAALVMAGSIAKSILASSPIEALSHVVQIGNVRLESTPSNDTIRELVFTNDARCADNVTASLMADEITSARNEGDSIGGIIECRIIGVPVGLGEPFFDSIESVISHAIFSIPGVKGIEFGAGFSAASMRGSEHNDSPVIKNGAIGWSKNDAGGVLGGISNGDSITFRVAFKPTPTISLAQETVNMDQMKETVLRSRGRHDPCIVPRATPVVASVASIVIADFLMRAKICKYP